MRRKYGHVSLQIWLPRHQIKSNKVDFCFDWLVWSIFSKYLVKRKKNLRLPFFPAGQSSYTQIQAKSWLTKESHSTRLGLHFTGMLWLQYWELLHVQHCVFRGAITSYFPPITAPGIPRDTYKQYSGNTSIMYYRRTYYWISWDSISQFVLFLCSYILD